jgi:hypothetical protein
VLVLGGFDGRASAGMISVINDKEGTYRREESPWLT